jgi:putative acyl-CoA dehydrogenase
MDEFFQQGPQLQNQFSEDRLLQKYLKERVPAEILAQWLPQLKRLGERAVTDMLSWSNEAEAHPPKHVPYDPWGRRIDSIETSAAWKNLERVAAEEGLIATGYERKYGDLSRVYQMCLLYLYHSSSAFFSCPLAMTDGAARAIELYGDDSLKKRAFKHLTSRDPDQFWTSGQWMTEKAGGSDVSGTATIAKKVGAADANTYELYGAKWFTSATTSQMAMTLARIEGAEAGSRGLSLFYLELRDSDGHLQNIEVHRLKDKLGTKALPTAELTLKGTPAILVGGPGGGVKKISSLFNITRIYNSVCAISHARRALALAWDYSQKRQAFGKKLVDLPLHLHTLQEMDAEFEGCFKIVMRAAELLGKDECGTATAEESALLRLLTPVAKLYTAKKTIQICSEALECFGGAGYVEDTGLPRLLRDAQVFSIWEGTTNVLSLDVIRALEKENAFPPFIAEITSRLAKVTDASKARELRAALEQLQRDFVELPKHPEMARTFAMGLGSLLGQVW